MDSPPRLYRSFSTSTAPNEAYKLQTHVRNFGQIGCFPLDAPASSGTLHAVEPLRLRKPPSSHIETPRHTQHRLSMLAKSDNIAPVQRWDGLARDATQWDCLKRDPELYDNAGDVAIYLHHNASSQLWPSFRLSRQAVVDAGCSSLFDTHCYGNFSMGPDAASSSAPASPSGSDSGYSSASSIDKPDCLYFPVPWMLSRDEALTYHLTTRNLFAWITDKPLVGDSLGQALINLLERMLVVRSATESSVDDLVAYANRQGYLDMANYPTHALSLLAFAEHAGCEQVQRDAFVHCVGMNDLLEDAAELSLIGKTTRAAIHEAAMTMRTRVNRVTAAVPTLFERDFASARLGLSPSQRDHLGRFRSFLHSFYVSKHGYWPPKEVPKSMLESLHHDFEALYDLLADKEDAADRATALLGGLCVLQNVDHFDSLHFFCPLPHSLPLLPLVPTSPTKSIFRSSSSRRAAQARALAALMAAVNPIPQTPLITAYLRFERDALSSQPPDLSASDARKVRWLAIYFSLQRLRSAVASNLSIPAPHALYFTCSTPPPPPVPKPKSALRIHPAFRNSLSSHSSSSTTSDRQHPAQAWSIQPDCATDPYLAPMPLRIVPRRLSSRRAASLVTLPIRRKTLDPGRERASSAPTWTRVAATDQTSGERGAVMSFAAALRARSDSTSSSGGSVYSRASVSSSGSSSASTYRASSYGSDDARADSPSTPETPLTPEMGYAAAGGSWYCEFE